LTKVFHLGLIGYPLSHSFSPKIHEAALNSCGLDGDYSLFQIHPEDHQGLRKILVQVRRGELSGLNVTIPHKQHVIPLLDELTPTAKAIGAVNTIYCKNGELIGDNTDAPGFLADLRKFLTTETRRHGDTKYALVLGAGGSSHAVVYALINNGWNVAVASRRAEQAQALINQISSLPSQLSSIEYHPTPFYSLFPDLFLIINTTPLGMFPDIDSSPWPDGLPFPPSATVYDLVYNPSETKLVRDARAAGLPATTGLGTLLEQAILSFQVWTGHIPSRDALMAAIH
jgi:shikimate dehydrogenase